MPGPKFPQINQVAVSGVVVNELEFRQFENGKARVNLSIAVNRLYRDDPGHWQEETTSVPVIVWDKLAEYSAERLHKGSSVFLTGQLRSRTFETLSGNRTVLEVVARQIQFLDKKQETEPQPQEAAPF